MAKEFLNSELINPKSLIEINSEVNTNRDKVLNQSQLESVFSSYFYYDNTKDQISSIVKAIIKNHPFTDGNKRTAFLYLMLCSEEFELEIKLIERRLFLLIITIATSNLEVEEISKSIWK